MTIKIWEEKVREYCEKYNIPVLYLAETLYEPKVVPMVRGKAFEFSVMMVLQKILPKNEWRVDKPIMNAQTSFHDIDVRVIHKPTKKIIRVECKLAKKGGYRLFADGHSEIRVKCMRSRTLGLAKVKELAPKLEISEKVLAVHNDQYLPGDFDVVISSVGNAFYTTDKKTGFFEWKPTKSGEGFLERMGFTGKENLRNFAFKTMFVAKASDMAIGKNGITCTRGLCKNKNACGFIPNYPLIIFDKKTKRPTNKWVPIKEVSGLFKDFIKS
ncbi:MAG: restriction endonuclease [Parcubacteria group bacterium]|nr:restriction endonuclease [Parcubacteria group bacterium]